MMFHSSTLSLFLIYPVGNPHNRSIVNEMATVFINNPIRKEKGKSIREKLNKLLENVLFSYFYDKILLNPSTLEQSLPEL